jgi:hypothetical protein
LGESLREVGTNAVRGGFVVARGFDLDEFADGFEQCILPGFEMVLAIQDGNRLGLQVSGSFHN